MQSLRGLVESAWLLSQAGASNPTAPTQCCHRTCSSPHYYHGCRGSVRQSAPVYRLPSHPGLAALSAVRPGRLHGTSGLLPLGWELPPWCSPTGLLCRPALLAESAVSSSASASERRLPFAGRSTTAPNAAPSIPAASLAVAILGHDQVGRPALIRSQSERAACTPEVPRNGPSGSSTCLGACTRARMCARARTSRHAQAQHAGSS